MRRPLWLRIIIPDEDGGGVCECDPECECDCDGDGDAEDLLRSSSRKSSEGRIFSLTSLNLTCGVVVVEEEGEVERVRDA